MDQRSSLPEAWVDRIFDKLLLTYGAAWAKKWEGLDIAEVKADWAHELAGFQASPKSIKFALEHLPAEFPPTVLQFRDACIRCPDTTPALPAPRGPLQVPPRVAQELSRLTQLQRDNGPKAWAYALQEREKSGERLSLAQRTMWRAALEGSES